MPVADRDPQAPCPPAAGRSACRICSSVDLDLVFVIFSRIGGYLTHGLIQLQTGYLHGAGGQIDLTIHDRTSRCRPQPCVYPLDGVRTDLTGGFHPVSH